MTNIRAGKLIEAADFPTTVSVSEDTDQLNLASTSFGKGSPACELTFVAPNSGVVMIYIGGAARNNSYNGTTNTDYVILSLDLRVGTSSGTVVESPSDQGYYTVRWPGPNLNFCVKQRVGTKSGLTPGQTYYASVQHRTVNGSSSADIANRSLIVRPMLT